MISASEKVITPISDNAKRIGQLIKAAACLIEYVRCARNGIVSRYNFVCTSARRPDIGPGG